MNKNTTYIEKMRETHRKTEIEVIALLGWDKLTLMEYKERKAYEFMSMYLADSPHIKELAEKKEFWTWWRMQWHKADKKWVAWMKREEITDGTFVQASYQMAHCLVEETEEFNQLETSFTAMIHLFVKELIVGELEQIKLAVSCEYGLEVTELYSPRRHAYINEAKQMATYIARKFLGKSLNELGRLFGGLNHETIINRIRRMEGYLSYDSEVQARYQRIIKKLRYENQENK